jgi:glycosyltransferase involved in cell wall biosynthesis
MAPNRKSLLHRIGYKIFYGIKSTLLKRPLKSLYDCPGALIREARRLSGEEFDIIVINYWYLHRLLDVLPPQKCVILTHDVDMLVNRQVSLLERNLMKKIQAVRRWLVEQEEEMLAYRRSGTVWTLTDRDKFAVESICKGRCTVDVWPVGIDVDFYAPSGMKRNRGEILFLGAMRAPFNRDAVDQFVRYIYPRIDEIEGLSITIVGGLLPKELAYFGLQQEVEVVGRVADIRPYLHRAACIVIPLRFGGGLRIRILEAISAGLPVVCSSVAVAGMPFEPEREFLLADTPDEFARQIARVLEDQGLAGMLSERASRRLRDAYGVELQTGRAVGLVNRFLSRP